MKNGIPEATHDLTRSEAIEHQLSNKFIAKFCACVWRNKVGKIRADLHVM